MDEAGNFQDNIRSLSVFGGKFTDIKGDAYHYHIRGNFHNHELEPGRGIDKLSQVVSLSAIHDSSERYPSPRCHPETRTLVRTLIICWIEDPDPTCYVLWLYGPAGAGKSAILQSIAEECCSLEAGRFGASFFFSRGKTGRDQGHYLFSTIAYQLALNLPYLRTPIDKAMQANPTLYTKSMMIQMRSLIIDSFRKLSERIDHMPTVIIDGLDECDGRDTQLLILEIIHDAVAIHKLPLRFLIASRSEAHIREAFDRPTLRSITKRVVLDESFGPNQDIEKYLRDGFKTIYDRNSTLMKQVVQPWPGTGVVDLLVQKASGQFIYASTVLKFVGAEFYNPLFQLDIILDSSPSNGAPFSELDRLYSQILSTYPTREKLICVLGTVLALHCPQPPEVIEDLLGLEAGDVGLVLRGLHSLIRFPDISNENSKKSTLLSKDNQVQLLHASFRDYLVDANRSGHFFIDINLFRVQNTKAGFQLMVKWISHSWGPDVVTRRPCPQTWGYLKWHLSQFYWQSSEELRDDIMQILLAHAELFWINHPNSFIIFEPLYCAMTTLVQMAFTATKWYDIPGHLSEIFFDRTMKPIERNNDPDKKFNEKLANIFYRYRDILDASLNLSFSESKDLEILMQVAPGFLVMEHFMPLPDAARMFDVNETIFLDLLKRSRDFVNFTDASDSDSPEVRLNVHVRGYLCDRSRSLGHFQKPRSHHLSICLKVFEWTFNRPWSDPESPPESYWYLHMHFKDSMRASDVKPSEGIFSDDPIWSFLDRLCQIDYYLPTFDNYPHPQHILHIWDLISETLLWVQRQQELLEPSDVHLILQYKLCAVVDRIYGQILRVDGSNENAVVTVCPPILAAIKYDIYLSGASSELKPVFQVPVSEAYYFDDPRDVKATGASHDLLLLPATLNSSLTEYLTSRTRAKNLYVDANTYHTQMVEFWLDRCLGSEGDNQEDLVELEKRENAGIHRKFHLVRAQPSQKIFARLGVLSWRSFVGVSNPPGDSFRAIISWLEGLLAPPLDIYLRCQKMLLAAEEQEANGAIQVPMNLGLLATEAQRLSPPNVIIADRAQSFLKDALEHLQDYVAAFVGWLLDT